MVAYLSSSMAWAALALAKLDNLVFTFPTRNLPLFLLFMAEPSTYITQAKDFIPPADQHETSHIASMPRSRIVTISSWGSSLSSISRVAVMYGLSLDILLLSVIWNFCRDIRGEDTAVHHIQWTTSLNNIEQTRYRLAIPWRNKTAWTTGDTNLSCEFYTINNDSDDSTMVQVRYGESMPFMLRGLTCTFPGELKTGIVGRTGRGKSTLMQALFRGYPEKENKILVLDEATDSAIQKILKQHFSESTVITLQKAKGKRQKAPLLQRRALFTYFAGIRLKMHAVNLSYSHRLD
ncbi:hypothetical protein ZIOFF_023335 [Zingiber officinale]|uniref:ABC transporter domain-containing protein n=1 Tax=Zingiber officinale TaxID=94328 RepID=A0A8J5L9V3_ZINOF|nr:hypothetical protein ZIOFF_023335 [Zingiber officinale]